MISSTDPLFILPLFIKREKKKTEVLNPQGEKKKKHHEELLKAKQWTSQRLILKENNWFLCLRRGTKSLLIRHTATSLCLAFYLLKQAKLCTYNIPDAEKQIRQNKNEDAAHMPAKRHGQGSDQCFLRVLGSI